MLGSGIVVPSSFTLFRSPVSMLDSIAGCEYDNMEVDDG